MTALGELYERRLTPPDFTAARRWFRRAIDAGHDAAAKSLEAPALPDHPQEHDVQPVQSCVADIGSGLDRMMSIHERDCEIVASGTG